MANEVLGYELYSERDQLISANIDNNEKILQINIKLRKILNDNIEAKEEKKETTEKIKIKKYE